jgi:Rrf2 family protein
MRIRLTKKGDYAVRAVLDIARNHPAIRSTREIAAAMDLPREFASQILATLVRYEILASLAGPAGGYKLRRPPAAISLLDIVEIVEGPVSADECILGGGSCNWVTVCPLHQFWSEAKSAFAHHLATITFDELARVDAEIRQGTYQLPDHTPPHPVTPPRRGTAD